MRRAPALLLLGSLLAGCGGLLAGCGGKDEGHPSLTVVLSYSDRDRPYMPQPEAVAKQIAGDLEEVGFTVELRKQEWGQYLPMTQRGEHQMALLGWSADVADADNFLYVLLDKSNARPGSAQNISFYVDETVHGLLERARYTWDEAARNVLYHGAQERILADVPMVPLAYSRRVIAHRKGVGPIALEPTTHPLLRLVTQPRDGKLLFVRGGDAVRLDPAQATDGESSNVIEQVFEGLVRYKPGTTDVEPALATSWSHDEESRVWTFRIRPGVRFHDGTPCDAAAVVNAFERQRDPKHPHHFTEKFPFWEDLLGDVEKVEAGSEPDAVVFRLARPAPAFFLRTLGVFAFFVPSPAALTQHGQDFDLHPVGTGPFQFVSRQTGVEIVLQRNEGWWGGRPALREIVYRKAGDGASRTQQLRAGQADVIDNVDLVTLPQLEQDPSVVVVSRPGLHVAYLAMHTQKAPFDDPRVREAVALALDKNRILQAGWQGRAEPAVTPLPPGISGHAADLVDRTRDVARAKALLAEALQGRK